MTDGYGSDHMRVITQLDVSVTPPAPVYRVVRNVRAINRAAFNEDLHAQLDRHSGLVVKASAS